MDTPLPPSPDEGEQQQQQEEKRTIPFDVNFSTGLIFEALEDIMSKGLKNNNLPLRSLLTLTELDFIEQTQGQNLKTRVEQMQEQEATFLATAKTSDG